MTPPPTSYFKQTLYYVNSNSTFILASLLVALVMLNCGFTGFTVFFLNKIIIQQTSCKAVIIFDNRHTRM